MSEAWPDVAGRIDGRRHLLPIRVYYEDTDFSGAVYHANYLKFCERARSDCLRLLGIHHHRLEGLGFVVRRMACEFLKPARIDDLLEVETSVREIAGARLILRQIVRRGAELLVEAEVTVVLVNRQGKARRIPDSVREVLEAGGG